MAVSKIRTTVIACSVVPVLALGACSSDNDGKATPAPGKATASATSASTSAESSPTSTTVASARPRLFPADFPYPDGLTVQESRDDTATGLLQGTVTGSTNDFEAFYDARLPQQGWVLNETASSGCAHQYTRAPLTVSVVCGQEPNDPAVTTFQLTVSTSG